MRPTCAVLLIALVVLATVSPTAQQPPFRDPQLFQSGVEVTSITATVFDKEGRLVKGLPRDAFEVYEDGQRQKVTQFTNERVPLGLGVLVDISDSMFGKRIHDARLAVDEFLLKLLDPADQFFILAFNHEPHVLTDWTNVPEVVRHALEALHPSGGTAVYDAVVRALPVLERRSRQRAALLIISDGADTASTASLRDVRSALLRSEAFVYAIAIDVTDRQAINARLNAGTLREITGESGGRTEVVLDSGEIAGAAARIAEELNSQYVLGYSSPRGADGKYHSIRVRATGGEYRVRARNGYVATPVQKKTHP
ncbi:MAG TPA: VWA domain-containing protein [Vicinamibacterales bacterium]|nr:VWA domain-containing protein [Vicinamibacterales bacterium]